MKKILLPLFISLVLASTSLASPFVIENESSTLTWCADIEMTPAPMAGLQGILNAIGARLEAMGYDVDYYLEGPVAFWITFCVEGSEGNITVIGNASFFKITVYLRSPGHKSIVGMILKTIWEM